MKFLEFDQADDWEQKLSALFVQGIPTKINTNDKRVVDAIKSFAEKRLQMRVVILQNNEKF